MQSYIIIGGGLAGLTAANALAQPGRKITILEQSEHLGGRAITQHDSAFFLNLGPHALYRGGPAMDSIWSINWKKRPLIVNISSLEVVSGRESVSPPGLFKLHLDYEVILNLLIYHSP